VQAGNLRVELRPGVSTHLADWLGAHGFAIDRCSLLVYPQAVEQGLAERLRLQLLESQPYRGAINPIAIAPDGLLTIDKARSCCELIWAHWRDAGMDDPPLIAIGGGSVMDLAKIARWFPTGEQGKALELLDDEDWFEMMLQEHKDFRRCALILMPSTAGTGSEVTAYATVWGSSSNREKLSFTGPACFADVALIDYELSLSCAYTLTRDCGLDALSHALDALWNRRACRSDRDEAIRIASNIVSTLPKLLRAPVDPFLRQAMSEAALDAGHLIARTQTSLVHALSYPLTSQEDLAHGLACAQWIAAVAALACEREPGMLGDLNRIWSIQAADPNALSLSLAAWLDAMGVISRSFDHQERDWRLADALSQARGKNFLEPNNRRVV
jgi:alcohol dehydrogenase class IV